MLEKIKNKLSSLAVRALESPTGEKTARLLSALDIALATVAENRHLVAVDGPVIWCDACGHLVPATLMSTKSKECTSCREKGHLVDRDAAIRRERDEARAQVKAGKAALEKAESAAFLRAEEDGEKIKLQAAAIDDERAERAKVKTENDSLVGLILLIAENLDVYMGDTDNRDPLVIGTRALDKARKANGYVAPAALTFSVKDGPGIRLGKTSLAPPPAGERVDEGAANAPAPLSSPRTAADTAPSSNGDWLLVRNGKAHRFDNGAVRSLCGSVPLSRTRPIDTTGKRPLCARCMSATPRKSK